MSNHTLQILCPMMQLLLLLSLTLAIWQKTIDSDSGVGDDTEYKDYMEILQRTGRFLSIKETNKHSFTITL